MSKPLVAYVNNSFVPLEKAMIHVEDRGFQFADGVYEVVACYAGTYLDLKPHLARLQRSCAAIAIDFPKSMAELEVLVQQAYEKNPFDDAMVYIQVTRGVAPRNHVVNQPITPTLVITVRELPKPSDAKVKTGVQGITLQDIRWKHCEIKSIALLASVMGKQEAVRAGVDEAFWLDAQGHVLEGCATNIFAVIDGVLVTHPLDNQVLGGITRNMAIEVAKDAGIVVQERAWKLDETGLSECLMSSTTNAVLPVCRMNQQVIGDGKPGEIGLKIRQLMLAKIDALRAA
ncbi:aminotransferase class IV [Ghiorsea bivora]|uniref:aminotransferase class IV n=1 Tax=Ghiorsea bivora TaxID=1485545 RepID=UPI0005705EDA|nr:aminotransferase class IV [Ghiorsea bivora]